MEKTNDAAKKDVAYKTPSELKFEQTGSPGPGRKKTGVGKRTDGAKQSAAKNAPSSMKENENPERLTKTTAENPIAPFYQRSKLNNISLRNENVQKSRVFRNALAPVNSGLNNTTATKNDAMVGAAKPVNYEKCARKVPELSLNPAVSDDGAPALMSTPPHHALEILDAKSVEVTTSDFVVFVNSSDLPPDQDVTISDESSNGSSPSDNASMQSEFSRFKSDFHSIEPLGQGGFGRVFKATKKLLDKCFAVKIVRCRKGALREVKALSDLHHCNIVRYYTCWLEESGYKSNSAASSSGSSSSSQSTDDSLLKYLYIQMELCSTKTLRVWIDEKNIQNVRKSLRDSKRREESLTIIIQIVTGVEYIHSKMLIHRDLKPENIMFGQDGQVKIGDFGLVTAENDDGAESLMERTAYKGTPSYMAPEQKSQKIYNQKVDIFALGLIFFELFWKASTQHEWQEVWNNVRSQKFPHGFSHSFLQEYTLIKPMLCEEPEERPEARKLKKDFGVCSQEKVRHASRSY
uniref:eukaryotic translation initiation factor 2-alpha kinase 3-like isoform X2 n=1 Tax=Scatophagus argus TaxID=75038 RepID=UPI001ED83F3B|nr:eukaryotic translation initiation factor 2-alpha kinase 3-like isoform X2 [Scatophagus argus]